MRIRGITLAEVLVSITIVAILASLVLTSSTSSIQSAKATVCLSNLRQLGAAMTLYEQDNGSWPPDSDDGPYIMPYLANTKLRCPYADIAQFADVPRLRTQYFLNGSWPTTPEQEECRQARGSAYPLAYDANHVSPLVACTAGRAFYIYVRTDGSASREDKRELDGLVIGSPWLLPCPKAPEFSNFK